MTDLKPLDAADQLALVPGQFKAVLAKPLRLLPAEVRPAALRVWACHRHLAGLESPLPLAALLAVWIGEYGLTADDASDVLGRMLDPECVGRHKFASDLTTTLATEVSQTLKRRRQAVEQARTRAEHERAAAEALPLSEIHAMLLNGIGQKSAT